MWQVPSLSGFTPVLWKEGKSWTGISVWGRVPLRGFGNLRVSPGARGAIWRQTPASLLPTHVVHPRANKVIFARSQFCWMVLSSSQPLVCHFRFSLLSWKAPWAFATYKRGAIGASARPQTWAATGQCLNAEQGDLRKTPHIQRAPNCERVQPCQQRHIVNLTCFSQTSE